MANTIRDFVKQSLNQFYKAQQVKMSNIATPNDKNPTIKITNDGSVYINGVGGFTGDNVQDAIPIQTTLNTIIDDDKFKEMMQLIYAGL